MEEKQLISSYNVKAKESLQGVVRLGVTRKELVDFMKSQPIIRSWSVTEENIDSDLHLHFIMTGHKKLMIHPTRKLLKDYVETLKKAPKKYLNGMLNLSRVQNPFKMLCYIYKDVGENQPITSNLEIILIKCAMKHSYQKVHDMQGYIKKIIEEVASMQLAPIDAYIQYRLLRKRSRKPDPNHRRFYEKMAELYLTDDEIREDCVLIVQDYEFNMRLNRDK